VRKSESYETRLNSEEWMKRRTQTESTWSVKVDSGENTIVLIKFQLLANNVSSVDNAALSENILWCDEKYSDEYDLLQLMEVMVHL